MGDRPFDPRQIDSCVDLCRYLIKEYNILPENFLGHSDIAPSRKIDPGVYFDWKALARRGVGIWHACDMYPIENPAELTNYNKLQMDLSKFGYKLDITGALDLQTMHVIRAFQSRFYPEKIRSVYHDPSAKYNWDEYSERVLKSLLSFRAND
jgi:N-acetylmuramoyl-L-alanine amidase